MLTRIMLDFAFEVDAAGLTKDPAAVAPLNALLVAIAAARPFAVWAGEREDTTTAMCHACAHPGGPCPDPMQIGVRPVKRVAVADAVPIEGEIVKAR